MGQPSVSPVFATGDNRIDALLAPSGLATKWGGPAGTGATLTYSVRTDGSTYADDYSELDEPVRGQGFNVNQAQADAFDAAIAAWAAVANINFVPVVESADVTADIRFGFSQATDLVNQDNDFAFETQAIVRQPSFAPAAGDIWFAPDLQDLDYSVSTSGGGYNLMLRTVGTAVFSFAATTSPGINGATLSEVENTQSFTVMSENASVGVEVDERNPVITLPTSPMLYDILAAQELYGPNLTHNAGDTVYIFAPGQQLYQTIWDAGGTDVLDWSNQTQPVLIDLNDGSYSTLGPPRSDGVTANEFTVAIAFNAFIENARGGVDSDTIIGNELDNFILANSGADSVRGFTGNDVIYGNIGNDILYGNQDADVLFGGQDADILYGGQDGDLIYGNFANDILYGNFASDILFGGGDGDILYGGKGPDQLLGNKGNDIIYGNKDADLLSGGPDSDLLIGGSGNDTLNGDSGNDELRGGSGLDVLSGADGDDTIDGGIEDDLITGDAGNDQINGGDNDDTIYGGDGSDIIDGGPGSDFIDGGEGADQLFGGLGNDTFIVSNLSQVVTDEVNGGTDLIRSQVNVTLSQNVENATALGPNSIILTGNALDNRLEGNDRDNSLIGQAGDDTLIGGLGDDTLNGGQGSDQLDGGFGNDTYEITDDADTIIEGATGGFDTVLVNFNFTVPENIESLILTGQAEATGSEGNNIITGSSGSDQISGRGGADTIDGADGADTIVGGSGDDSLTGGGGVDRFVYTTGNTGNDTITDYEAGLDLITIDNGISVVSSNPVGVDTVLTLSSGTVLTLLGVNPADITIEDLDMM
ncbi:MAG: M10 family metallopeptidase C-terminal domain-containing protein [Alphaproteobacteria bacterium]|nr:M10 family metallopeptidase C-terminal domain-containing protein [Alphaproteobacteria bacterium SS10]